MNHWNLEPLEPAIGPDEQLLRSVGRLDCTARPSLRGLRTRILTAARRSAAIKAQARRARLLSSSLVLVVGTLLLAALTDNLPVAQPQPAVLVVVREAKQPWELRSVVGEPLEPFPEDGTEWSLAQHEFDPVQRLRRRLNESLLS